MSAHVLLNFWSLFCDVVNSGIFFAIITAD